MTWNANILTWMLAGALGLLTSFLSLAHVDAQVPDTSTVISSTSSVSTTIYLPLVLSTTPDEILSDRSIWAHSDDVKVHEIALFRDTFSLPDRLTEAQLHIFADTRYEVWIDGQWIGRGPARFSEETKEYDVYNLADLTSGQHVIAVKVQWAPNTRRAESTAPMLIGHLEGEVDGKDRIVTRTDLDWKAILSQAWNYKSSPVHSWDLIGPTELLDFRDLPKNWMQIEFDDGAWSSAKPISLPEATYRPRSIPLLENIPISITVIDQGELSPGLQIVEITESNPSEYKFYLHNPRRIKLEALSKSEPPVALSLDGESLSWVEAPDNRPDVWVANTSLNAGAHILSIENIPDSGFTFAVSELERSELPFEQGNHAGRRLLLANPVSDSSTTKILSQDKLNIEFINLPAYVLLDLGRVVHGRVSAEVTGPTGTVVDIGWAQRLWLDERALPYPGSLHPQWNQVDSWVLDGTTRKLSTIDARAGRYVLIAAWGESPIRLENLQVLEERYPVTQRGSFHTPDRLYNQIWEVGVETLYPNMTDAFTDTPWRERGQWWGDVFVEDHINRVTFGDTQLLRRGLYFMTEEFEDGKPPALAPHGQGATLLDYGMLWVQSLEDYVKSTEDLSLLNTSYPVLKEFLEHLSTYENTTTDLLDIPRKKWSQTALIDWAGTSSRYGQSTALNAMYYGTLLDAAKIAEKIGDAESADMWRKKADLVRYQINARLYDEETERYISTIYAGERIQASPHAQAWSLAYHVPPETKIDLVVNSLLDLLSDNPRQPNVEIYGMYWVLKGLGDFEYIAEALQILETYYGNLINLGATTWWEVFNADSSDLYYESLAHGWGGSPTWFLTKYVLGIQIEQKDSWTVKPSFAHFRAITGSVPFQGNTLVVRWQKPNCQKMELEIQSPDTASGEVVLPNLNNTGVITMNESVIWKRGQPLTEGVVEKSDGIHITLLEADELIFDMHQQCNWIYLPQVENR